MTKKTFIPKGAAKTKQQIWSYFYMANVNPKGQTYCWVSFQDVDKPAFTPDEIPDSLCQEFIDKEFEIDHEAEEDEVNERNALIAKYFKKIKEAVRRSKRNKDDIKRMKKVRSSY